MSSFESKAGYQSCLSHWPFLGHFPLPFCYIVVGSPFEARHCPLPRVPPRVSIGGFVMSLLPPTRTNFGNFFPGTDLERPTALLGRGRQREHGERPEGGVHWGGDERVMCTEQKAWQGGGELGASARTSGFDSGLVARKGRG